MTSGSSELENVVFLDSNEFVHIIYHGDQTKASLQSVVDKAMGIMLNLIAEDKPVNMLADIRDMGKHTPAARMVGIQARTTMPFWKMAIVVSKTQPYTAKISQMITAMSGRKKEIGYFKSEVRAAKWLDKND